eukprot:475166-Rhodomonas_salina.1
MPCSPLAAAATARKVCWGACQRAVYTRREDDDRTSPSPPPPHTHIHCTFLTTNPPHVSLQDRVSASSACVGGSAYQVQVPSNLSSSKVSTAMHLLISIPIYGMSVTRIAFRQAHIPRLCTHSLWSLAVNIPGIGAVTATKYQPQRPVLGVHDSHSKASP